MKIFSKSVSCFLFLLILFPFTSSAALNVAIVTAQQPVVDDSVYRSELNLLKSRLEEEGFTVSLPHWTNPEINWREYDLVLIGSVGRTMEYASFRDWCRFMSTSGVRLQNGPESLIFYTNKARYLKTLQEQGVNITPTEFVSQSNYPPSLSGIAKKHGWDKVVVKGSEATFGGSNFSATLTEITANPAVEEKYRKMATDGDVLVQKHMSRISEGEISFLFYGNRFSHAIKKVPAQGEHRIHAMYGGQHFPYEPTQKELKQVYALRDTITSVTSEPVEKARFDMVRDEGDDLAVIEIELGDPVQYFHLLEDQGYHALGTFISSLKKSLLNH